MDEDGDRAQAFVRGAGRRPWAVLTILNGPEDGLEIPLWVEPGPSLGARVTVGREEDADVRFRYDPAIEAGTFLILGPTDFDVVTGGQPAGKAGGARVQYGTPCRVGNTWLVIQRCAEADVSRGQEG